MNNGGDVLASGRAQSAQFAGASNNITEFENDCIYMAASEVCEKYGLSISEYDKYGADRLNGEHLPDLRPTSEQAEQTLDAGFSIADHRRSYLSPEPAKAAKEEVKKYPESEFEEFTPIMDRILVMRITDDPDEEMLDDGSTRNRKTGLITAAKYRQHSNVGIVLKAGQWVVLSGTKFPMADFVKPGDKVTFGDYNSEVFPMDEKKVQAICDNLQVNYAKDPQGTRIVRAQDVRGVERRKCCGSAYDCQSCTAFMDVEQDGVK